MSWLPHGTVLGNLEFAEVFVDFDGPRVFSCLSMTDQMYIGGWAEEGSDVDTWLYVPVSPARLRLVRSGGLTLRSAYERPEGTVFVVTMPNDSGSRDNAEPIAPGDVPESWLPQADFRLSLPTPTAPLAPSGETLERTAIQESRARFRLMVKLPKYTRSEAPTKKIGELLVSTQSLYDNVGLAILQTDPPQTGRLPREVAEETSTDLVGLTAASFVVEIASNKLDDLLGQSVFAQVTVRILSLLDVSLQRDDLLQELSELRPRGAKSFRNFVKGLANTGGSVTVAGAGTVIPYAQQELSTERLQTLSKILNNLVPEDIFEIRGRMRLYKADMDRRQFGLIDETSEDRFEGQIANRALAQVDHATVNETYDVLISEFRTFDEAVGERKPIHVLEQLVPVEPGSEHRPLEVTRVSEPSPADGAGSPD